MFRLLHTGIYAPGQLHTRWVESKRRIVPEVEAAIEAAWHEANARPGVHLFDGAVCRLEAIHDDGQSLTLDLSRTSYRIIIGTNYAHPEFVERYGSDVMANPVGVSTLLITSDDYLLMGLRNARVAYYPNRVHPFAGSLDVQPQIDLFDNVRRELREELALTDADITDIRCLGINEDLQLRHPETIYVSRTRLTRAVVESQVNADEHTGLWQARNEAGAVAAAITDPILTPMACALLLAHGREAFGQTWFDETRRTLPGLPK